MKVSELLETRAAPLYHFMNYKKANAVFINDTMKAMWGHVVRDEAKASIKPTQNPERNYGFRKSKEAPGKIWGNSFTRRPDLRVPDGYDVVLVVDKSLLNLTNKIIPVNGNLLWGKSGDLDQQRDISEEFVIDDIKNLHKSIIEIRLKKSASPELVKISQEYGKKWNIPVNTQ